MVYLAQSIAAFVGLLLTAIGLSTGAVAAYNAFFFAAAILVLLGMREFMVREEMTPRAAIADMAQGLTNGANRGRVAGLVIMALFGVGLMASGAFMGVEHVTQSAAVIAK